MSITFRPAFFLCSALTFTAIVHAQSVPQSNDDGWSRLKRSEQDVIEKHPDSGSTQAADFLARANELRDYRNAHAKNGNAGEVRRLEALMLVYAAVDGDNSERKRREDLVAEVRTDKTLAPNDRFSLASLSDWQDSHTHAFISNEAQLAQDEKTARDLVVEFPDATSPYEALLAFAKDCPEAKATGIARDLLKLSAPQSVKDNARLLLNRVALIGTPLKSTLNSALAAKDRPTLPKNNLTILYPWVSTVEGTLVIAEEIAAKAPSGTTIIGVNLDTDPVAARKVAAERKLPGIQLYDASGQNSPLARALSLAADNVVFITNREGTILSVTARPDLSTKINSAAQ